MADQPQVSGRKFPWAIVTAVITAAILILLAIYFFR